MSDISKKAKPGKKESKTKKKQFWSHKAKEAHKDMKEAKRTGNGGWQKMLKKRLAKYHSHTESTFPTFAEYLKEAQYDKYSNNPEWDPEKPLTSGDAFKPWEPEGGWSKKKNTPSKTRIVKKKEPEEPEEDELDVEGDPVGSFISIAEPQPEEDHSASMMFVSNADLEKIYNADESLFNYLFQGSEAATEEPEGIVFRYLAPQIRQKIEQRVHSLVVRENYLAEAKRSKKKMKNTCRDDYKPIGTKTKNGKQVPNCVPESVVEEALDNPYPYQWSERDGGFIFFPDPKNQSILYTVLMMEDPEYAPSLTIMFHYTDEDKNIQGTADMTGTGNAFRVMSTVLKIVNDYLDKHSDKYEMIRFSANNSDHGRQALYKRLAHQIKNRLGSKWELDVFRTRHDTTFELSKAAI